MERMAKYRLNWYTEKHQLIKNYQSGFRQQRSVQDNLAVLSDAIQKALATGGHTLAVFLDFEKAYDRVWRTGLLLKLISKGITGNILAYVKNLLSNTKFKIKLGTCLSNLFDCDNGVLQGSSLSPNLFLFMIDDLADKIKQVACLLFADDATLYKTGTNITFTVRTMQDALDVVQQWCEAWGLRVSAPKSAAIIFAHPTNPAKNATLL